MNLISSTVIYNNLANLSQWVDSTPMPQLIDSMTYDLYESSNPFRTKFSKTEINNKNLRIVANSTTAVSAEIFSAFTNPYYLSHKVTRIPVYYQNAVKLYNKPS